MVFIAKSRDGQFDLGLAIYPWLGLGVLHCPAGVAILLTKLGRIFFPFIWNSAFLEGRFLASTNCPDIARYPAARKAASKRSNNRLIA